MSYAAEVTEENDSDTFDSQKSCPVCYIPDNYPEIGFYMSYDRLTRMAVGLTAVGFVGYGWWLARKRV
jgi:hypothetical protein